MPDKTKSTRARDSISFNPSTPIVHSLSGYLLQGQGWQRVGSEYKKDGKTINYDGVHWWQGTTRLQFLEDIT